jgi:hypothetical protein|tara:strand:+ start:14092 stop:15300 length:1209 start_codon:yes stop_codon:yes gene_type:complete
MRSKFELTFENYAGKFTKGGFLPGDFVKFKEDVLSHPSVVSGSDDYKSKIKELMDGDAHLRISTLTNTTGAESAGADGTADQYVATIYQTMPGNSAASTDNVVTVPLAMLNKIARTSDETQMRVPDSFRRAADKRVNHTNQHKATADLESDAYDSGKDWADGKRSGKTGDKEDEFEKDSDASGTNKKKVNESALERAFDAAQSEPRDEYDAYNDITEVIESHRKAFKSNEDDAIDEAYYDIVKDISDYGDVAIDVIIRFKKDSYWRENGWAWKRNIDLDHIIEMLSGEIENREKLDYYNFDESTIREDVKVGENLKFYVYSNQQGEWVHERNVSNRENVDVERMFKKWIKAESGGSFKVTGKDDTNSGGEYYARIADTKEGVRVMDSMSFFVGSVEDTNPKK